jgi:hypothetical protein
MSRGNGAHYDRTAHPDMQHMAAKIARAVPQLAAERRGQTLARVNGDIDRRCETRS